MLTKKNKQLLLSLLGEDKDNVLVTIIKTKESKIYSNKDWTNEDTWEEGIPCNFEEVINSNEIRNISVVLAKDDIINELHQKSYRGNSTSNLQKILTSNGARITIFCDNNLQLSWIVLKEQ